jgi:membrane protein DedA with SNARE-associated domain
MNADAIISNLSAAPPGLIYLALFACAFIENFFPPIPGDAIVIAGGFLSVNGPANAFGCFLSASAGGLGGGVMMYFAGTRILHFAQRLHASMRGPGFLKSALSNFTSDAHLERTRQAFDRYGAGLVIVSRFLAGVRFFVSVVAGAARMNFPLFVACFVLGVIAWNALLVFAGVQLGDNWRLALEWIRVYSAAFAALLALAAGGWFGWMYWKRKRAYGGSTNSN